MGGNGGDNAHNNAFGGGKNPGIGNSGSGNHSGGSGNSGNSGGSSGGSMRAPTASEVAGQYNSYGGTQISASQVSNIRSDGEGGYKADIQGASTTVSSETGSHTSSTLVGFSGVPTSGHGNNHNTGSDGNSGNSDPHQGSNNTGSSGGHAPTAWDRTAGYYNGSDKVSRKALQNMYEKAVSTGRIPDEARGELREYVQAMLNEDSYQANFHSMLERARQLALAQSVGAANTEELRAAFIRDRAGFRPADLAAINAELDRATIAEIGYQANYRSMLERAQQLAQSQSVGAANTEELRAAFIRDRAGFRPGDLAAINAELDRATIEADEKVALTKASELIADMGDKIGEYLGDKYKRIAKEIADDVKSYQGKTIRSYDDAMTSLNKIISNPNMKINQAGKDALINAWKSLNASDIANKLGNLSRAFKAADVVMKVEKIREKSIHGYETGDWGPLVLEVESWVLSGVAVGVAMGILADVAPAVATSVNLPVIAITILGIITIAVIASFIDDNFADKVNNELIKPAH